MTTLPRGLRNCNPGNIRITKDKWQGLRVIKVFSSLLKCAGGIVR